MVCVTKESVPISSSQLRASRIDQGVKKDNLSRVNDKIRCRKHGYRAKQLGVEQIYRKLQSNWKKTMHTYGFLKGNSTWIFFTAADVTCAG